MFASHGKQTAGGFSGNERSEGETQDRLLFACPVIHKH